MNGLDMGETAPTRPTTLSARSRGLPPVAFTLVGDSTAG